MGRDRPTALITDAAYSQDRQRHGREIRYVAMMAVRVVSLIAAAVLAVEHAPLPWLWGPVCLAGMVIVPWLAVILANDRPPKDRYRLPRNRTGPRPDGSAPGQRPRVIGPAADRTVIDAER